MDHNTHELAKWLWRGTYFQIWSYKFLLRYTNPLIGQTLRSMWQFLKTKWVLRIPKTGICDHFWKKRAHITILSNHKSAAVIYPSWNDINVNWESFSKSKNYSPSNPRQEDWQHWESSPLKGSCPSPMEEDSPH